MTPSAQPDGPPPSHSVDARDGPCQNNPASRSDPAEHNLAFDLTTTGTGVTSTRWGPVLACGLAAVAVLGCQNGDEIRRYQAPHEPRVRMLAAIVPHEESTWFVRLTGPDPAVESHKADFRAFVESFRFEDKAEPPVTWTVPKGWRKDLNAPRKGAFGRVATFRLPVKEGDDLELTVVKLGRQGQAGDTRANVNRWRGQLGLEPVSADELKGVTEQLKVGDTAATLVDLKGTGSRLVAARPMLAEGGPGPEKPVAEPAKEPAAVTYKVPEGWKKAPPKPFSVATFRTGEGDKSAEVTVSPLKGQAGGLRDNLNRWRQQVGLPPADGEEWKRLLRETEIAGQPAVAVELIGPERAGDRKAILGALTMHGGYTWFFKMSGPADAVTNQKAAFDTFVRSVRFDGDKGGQQ
jgi:hypothetical protein